MVFRDGVIVNVLFSLLERFRDKHAWLRDLIAIFIVLQVGCKRLRLDKFLRMENSLSGNLDIERMGEVSRINNWVFCWRRRFDMDASAGKWTCCTDSEAAVRSWPIVGVGTTATVAFRGVGAASDRDQLDCCFAGVHELTLEDGVSSIMGAWADSINVGTDIRNGG